MTTKKARATAKKATRQQRRQRRSSKRLGGGGDQGGGFEEGGGFYSGGETGDGKDGDVVFLTEGDGGVGRLFGVGFGGEELLEAFDAEDFAGGVAGFGEAVGVEGEAVVDVELDGEFVVAGGGHETERERRGDVELVVVEEGWEVAGVGDGAGSVGVEAQDEAGDEAVLETVVQAAVEAGEDFGGLVEDLGEGA